jgi:uncharacterized lipoprotein YajG
MKKLNNSFLKIFNVLLVVLMGVFGFSNCASKKNATKTTPETPAVEVNDAINKPDSVKVGENPERIRLMYGSPTRNFRQE